MSIQQMMLAAGVGARYASATGGTVTYNGNWQIHTFTSSGTFQFTEITDGSKPVRILVVNGGGTGQNGGNVSESDIGASGGNGAAGGLYQDYTPTVINGWGLTSRSVVVGGAGSPSTFPGLSGNVAGGSGGAGGAGGQGNNSGGTGNSGGAGVDLVSFYGTRYSAGGGGGGGGSSDSPVSGVGSGGAGGIGGGGAGGAGGDNDPEVAVTAGANGLINSGSGGGGGGGAAADTMGTRVGGLGGLGGSGVVIVSFQYTG